MQTCVGCGKGAPETDTNYTLISAQFGWRLTRTKQTDGTITLEWRCPTCWRDHKRSKTGATTISIAGAYSPEMRPPAGTGSDGPPTSRPPPRTQTSRAPGANAAGEPPPRRSKRHIP